MFRPRAGPCLTPKLAARRLCKGEGVIGVIAHFMAVTVSQPICSGAACFINLGSHQRRCSGGGAVLRASAEALRALYCDKESSERRLAFNGVPTSFLERPCGVGGPGQGKHC